MYVCMLIELLCFSYGRGETTRYTRATRYSSSSYCCPGFYGSPPICRGEYIKMHYLKYMYHKRRMFDMAKVWWICLYHQANSSSKKLILSDICWYFGQISCYQIYCYTVLPNFGHAKLSLLKHGITLLINFL